MTPSTPKYASSKFYDKDKDVLKDGASDAFKEEYEKLHNGADWMLFYKELHPEMKRPYKKWNGTIVDKSRMDDADDDEGNGGGSHGNTKIPFGLCQREGIKVQPGWTPQDAWNALEGKGYNAKETYKELKETGKVSSKVKAFKYERPEAQTKTLKSLIRKTANLKNEQYRIIDQNGNVVLEKKGDRHSVAAKLGEKREHMPGNISLHNHPNGGTFSPDDLSDFGTHAKEIVVAGRDGVYSLANANWDDPMKRTNGWVPMKEKLEKAMEEDPRFEDYRMEDYKLRNKIAQEQRDAGKFEKYDQIQSELIRMHNEEGADLRNPTGKVKEMLDEYNRIEEQLAKERNAEMRRRVVKPFDDFYRENAEKYGFIYTFTPTKKRRKDARADAADANSYRARRELRLRARYGENYDAVMAFRARRATRLDAKEKGRWVTTENDHKIHLSEEGKPDKGNPYVLAVMKGEGNPESTGGSKLPAAPKVPGVTIRKNEAGFEVPIFDEATFSDNIEEKKKIARDAAKKLIPDIKKTLSTEVKDIHRPEVNEKTRAYLKEQIPKVTDEQIGQALEESAKIYKYWEEKEPSITTAVVETVKNIGGSMYGLDNRLKFDKSLAKKMIADACDPKQDFNGDIVAAAAEIKDGARYTAVFDGENLAEGYKQVKEALEKIGMREYRCKNFWKQYKEQDGTGGKIGEQKSIQCVFETPDGQKFELQFHTPESMAAKEVNHPTYKQKKEPYSQFKEHDDIRSDFMRDTSSVVPDPPGVFDIEEHQRGKTGYK